jgi:hypothetical protein
MLMVCVLEDSEEGVSWPWSLVCMCGHNTASSMPAVVVSRRLPVREMLEHMHVPLPWILGTGTTAASE